MSRFGVFKINGVAYDMDELTLDEVEEIETNAGGEDVGFGGLNFGSAKTMKAIAFTLMKRTDPALEMAAVGKVRMLDFVQGDEEVPATGPPVEGAEKSPNGSAPVAAGALASVESIAG
jgi:hypothetical protein